MDGEHSRTPFPWGREDESDAATLEAYVAWVGLRRDRVALRRGGSLWVDAATDSMTYLREHPDERILVHLARADHGPVRIGLRALGSGTSARSRRSPVSRPSDSRDGTLALPRGGPAAHAYLLG